MNSISILAKDLEIGDIVKNKSIIDISKNTYKGSNPRYHQSKDQKHISRIINHKMIQSCLK